MKRLIVILVLFQQIASAQSNVKLDSIRNFILEYNYQAALNIIDRQIKLDNKLLHYKGLALKGLQKYNEALDSFEQVYKRDSLNFQAVIEIANIYKIFGDNTRAYVALKRADKIHPSNSLKTEIASTLLNQEEFSKALEIYFSLLKQDSTNTYFIKNAARCLEGMEEFDDAIRFYEKAMVLNANDYQSVQKLSNILIKKKNFQRGMEITDAYRKLDTSNIKINRTNAFMYYSNKKYEEAEMKFGNCIVMNDTSDFVMKYLGMSLFRQEKYFTAKKYLAIAFAQDTTDSQACYYLGVAYSRSMEAKKGIEYLNKAIQLLNPAPTYMSSVHQNLAEAYNGDSQSQNALKAYLEARRLDPSDTLLIYKIAVHYDLQVKDKAQALKYYDVFMSTRPPMVSGKPKSETDRSVASYYDAVQTRMIELRRSDKIK